MTSSSDEGEIIEDGGQHTKAPALQRTEGSSVDRQDRNINSGPSPDDSASRREDSQLSRMSRSPRGYKRHHDDYDSRDHRRGYDDRRSRHHDDARRDIPKRSRVSYDDLDSPGDSNSPGSRANGRRDRYNDRDADLYDDRPRRQRSRSPRDSHRDARRDNGRGTKGSNGHSSGVTRDSAKSSKGVAFTDHTTRSDSDAK